MDGNRRSIGSFRLCMGLGILMIVAGCSGTPPQKNPAWTPVEITDAKMVAGEWEGTVKEEKALFPAGSVRLTVHDNGTYQFVGQNAETTVVGSGPLQVQEGRLVGKTVHRMVTLELYDFNGKEIIVADAISRETGVRYHGEFRRAVETYRPVITSP